MPKVFKVINPQTGKVEEWTQERIDAYQRTYGHVERATTTSPPPVEKAVPKKSKRKTNGR